MRLIHTSDWQIGKPFGFADDAVREVLREERLQAIGAIMLAWNWIEGAIDTSLAVALELHPDMWTDITSRINGMDGKIAILKASERLLSKQVFLFNRLQGKREDLNPKVPTALSNLVRMLYSRAGSYPPQQPMLYAEDFSPNTPQGACPIV